MDKTCQEIADVTGTSCSTAYYDCQEVDRQFRESAEKDFQEAKQKELARLERWRRESIIKFEEDGDIRWMDMARRIEEMILKIYGVNAAEKHEVLNKSAIDELLAMSDEDRENLRKQLEEQIGKPEGITDGGGEDPPCEG